VLLCLQVCRSFRFGGLSNFCGKAMSGSSLLNFKLIVNPGISGLLNKLGFLGVRELGPLFADQLGDLGYRYLGVLSSDHGPSGLIVEHVCAHGLLDAC
jgi:hypothetical protein